MQTATGIDHMIDLLLKEDRPIFRAIERLRTIEQVSLFYSKYTFSIPESSEYILKQNIANALMVYLERNSINLVLYDEKKECEGTLALNQFGKTRQAVMKLWYPVLGDKIYEILERGKNFSSKSSEFAIFGMNCEALLKDLKNSQTI